MEVISSLVILFCLQVTYWLYLLGSYLICLCCASADSLNALTMAQQWDTYAILG